VSPASSATLAAKGVEALLATPHPRGAASSAAKSSPVWSPPTRPPVSSLALACSGVAGLFVGHWVDRHGPRLLMTAGSCAAALLLLALSAVHTLLLFYLIWAALGVAMAAIFYEPAFAAIATWFSRYRARALTIITFVGGFDSVIFIPLISWLIRAHGWRTTFVILAMVLATVTIPFHALVLRRRLHNAYGGANSHDCQGDEPGSGIPKKSIHRGDLPTKDDAP